MEIALSMTKDEILPLTKEHPSLNVLAIGLGWDKIVPGPGEEKYDLDAFVVCAGTDGKKLGNDKILYWGSPKIANGFPGILGGAIALPSGDNLDGEGDGDDETVTIKLKELSAEIDQLFVGVVIHKGAERGQYFSKVKNSFVRLYNAENESEGGYPRYDLREEGGRNTGFLFVRIYRNNGEWKIESLGKPVNGDINTIAAGL